MFKQLCFNTWGHYGILMACLSIFILMAMYLSCGLVMYLNTQGVKKNIKKIEFANSVGPEEAAHNEPPLLCLHCLPSVFELSIL